MATTITVDDVLDRAEAGTYQRRLLAIFGLVWTADAMQVLAVGFDLAQHGTQAGVGVDAQHHGVGFAEQMAIGQLDEHGRGIVAAGQGVDACQVRLLRSFCTGPYLTEKTRPGAHRAARSG